MKKVQILIITLVSLLTVAGIVFAVLFFTTDTFKSDKEMFYTYISQMNVDEVINVDSQENYQKRLKNEISCKISKTYNINEVKNDKKER